MTTIVDGVFTFIRELNFLEYVVLMLGLSCLGIWTGIESMRSMLRR